MKGFLKKIFLGIGLIILLLVIASTVIATFFEQEVSQKLLVEINKSLKTELKIEEFDLSLLSGFPKVSANLRNISLADNRGGILLEADNLAFRFGLLSLLGSSIKVHSVEVEHGALYIHTDKKGRANYDILEASKNSKEGSSDFGFSLEEATLDDIEVIYIDELTELETRVYVENAIFSGQFSSDRFSMESAANIKSDFIESGDVRYLAGKNLSYVAVIGVDMENGVYKFKDVGINLEGNDFVVNGDITQIDKGNVYNLTVENSAGSVESIFQLLPEEYLESVGDIESTGSFLFKTTINGLMSDKSTPAIDMTMNLKDGIIKTSKLSNSLKDVSFRAGFTNGKYKNNKTSFLEIENFKGYFNRELIEMQLKLVNLDDPSIDFSLDGVLPLASVYGLLDIPTITSGDGEIEIKKLNLDGKYEDMLRTSRISRVDASGIIEFDDASLTINKQKMIIDRGQLEVRDNKLRVKEVKLEGAGSEMLISGDFTNLIPVMFADSINSKDATLDFKAKLDARELDLDRLWKLSEIEIDEDDVQDEVYDSLMVEQTLQRERIINFLDGTFDINTEAFNYNKIEGEDFDGSLTFKDGNVLIDGDVETMEGSMNLEGKIYMEDEPRLKANLICEEINLREFFRQTENFGQDYLVSSNLKGTLNSHITINSYWDEKGAFDYDKLRVLAGVSVEDGELIGFKMLEDFSTFVKIKDLRHIRFNNLENWMEINRGNIILPVMFIQSNAVNLTVSGEHSFDHDIDYNLKVNAGQVLLNRFKKHDSSLSPNKAKKKGWFNLYYKIAGTLEDYDFRSSKRDVQKDFVVSEHRKKEIQKRLEKEFGEIKMSDSEPELWRDKAPIPEYPEAQEEIRELEEMKKNEDDEMRASIKLNPKLKKLFDAEEDDIPEDSEEEVEFLFEEGEGL